MFLLGSLVNAGAVILGSAVGLLLPKIPDRMKDTVMQGLSLAILLIGLSMALSAPSSDILIIIISMVVGAFIGEWLDIERALLRLGHYIERGTSKVHSGQIAEGFVTASLVFCIGAMAIVGAIQSGISNNHTTLFAKSLLDLVSAVVFASTLGLGVMLSAVPVLIYEGLIAFVSHFAGGVLQNAQVIATMSATGGLLIAAIGVNIMGLKKIAVGNLLPAMFIAPLLKWLVPFVTHAFH